MSDTFFQNLASRLAVNAVEVGLTVELNETQKKKYGKFLAQLKHSLDEHEDVKMALEVMLRRPDSRGSKIFFQEELEELCTLSPAISQAIIESAQAFLAEVKTEPIALQEVVITPHGKYNVCPGEAPGIVIGGSNSVIQSFN